MLKTILGELASMFKRQFGPELGKRVGEFCIPEYALLRSFQAKLKDIIGNGFNHRIGFKIKALLNNIEDMKSLVQQLINRCCVQFFVTFKHLRFHDAYVEADANMSPESAFSIWRFCDEATSSLIDEIYQLARSRLYTLAERDQKL